MSVELEPVSYDWGRLCLSASSMMAEPFCKVWEWFRYRLPASLTPNQFENCTSKVAEVGIRALIVLGGLAAVAVTIQFPLITLGTALFLGLGSRALRALGFALQKGGYTHVRGTAKEIPVDLAKGVRLLTWNICGIGGGMSLDHGGVISWRERVGSLVQKIRQEDPGVLILQEVYDTALAEKLVDALKDRYAHIYMHLGPNAWGGVGGCMIFCKHNVSEFTHTSFNNNSWELNRGFGSLTLSDGRKSCITLIGTHLIHGAGPKADQSRCTQVAQIVDQIRSRTIPVVMAGDYNIERDSEQGKQAFAEFRHAYKGKQPTCTNQLTAQWDPKAPIQPEETIDNVSVFTGNGKGTDVDFQDCLLVRAFDDRTYNTKTALSDHHGVSVLIKQRAQ